VYALIARGTKSPDHVSQEIDALQAGSASAGQEVGN